MSQTNDLIVALVAQVKTALPDYTVEGKFTPLHTLDAESYPLAMLFEPTQQDSVDDLCSMSEVISVSALLLRGPEDALEVRDDVDSVRNSLDATPRVGGIVDRAYIVDSVVLETLEKYVVAVLTLETSRERSA